jgi:hypothetical protein
MKFLRLFLILFFTCIALIIYHYPLHAQEKELIERLELISHHRNKDDFLAILWTILGKPTRMFKYQNFDVWFYPKVDTAIIEKPLERVYILFKNDSIVEIKSLDSELDPFYEFEDP